MPDFNRRLGIRSVKLTVAVFVAIAGAFAGYGGVFTMPKSGPKRVIGRRHATGNTAAGEISATEPALDLPVVAVLGAGGRTGALIVEELLKMNVKPRALTRSGRWSSPNGREMTSSGDVSVEVGRADVTDAASLATALVGVSAVVFAAAYSRGSTLPRDIDNSGLVKTAQAVRDLGVQRLVVVSSAATTRPYAPVGVLLNTIGSGVLFEKLQGESEMRGILDGSDATYTVVKPGGLKMTDAVGFENLEFNQGDTFVGGVPRADVAAVAATAAVDPENRAAGKTFEMYEAKTRNGLLPWYGESKYVVAGCSDCGEMLGALLEDKDVKDVPGFLPF